MPIRDCVVEHVSGTNAFLLEWHFWRQLKMETLAVGKDTDFHGRVEQPHRGSEIRRCVAIVTDVD